MSEKGKKFQECVRNTNIKLRYKAEQDKHAGTKALKVIRSYSDLIVAASEHIIIQHNKIESLEDRVSRLELRVEMLENQSKLLGQMENHLHAIKANIPAINNAKYLIVDPNGVFYIFSNEEKIAHYLETDVRSIRQAIANRTNITDPTTDIEYIILKASDLVK